MWMDFLTCGLVNGIFAVFNVVGNVFFIFCMVCPLHGERIKQPLKLLLGSLVCCTTIYLVSAVALFFYGLTTERFFDNFWIASNVVLLCSLSTSVTSTVWLNFFYYTQIVPAQRALFFWIKKNIKRVIYCIYLADKLFGFSDVFFMLSLSYRSFDVLGYNATVYDDTIYLPAFELGTVAFCIAKFHFIVCVCVMMMSSGSTVFYLCRHMRRMVANGQPLSHARFRSQVRVTIAGILQGVTYVFCAVWAVYNPNPNSCSQFTVVNLYIVGTTFNLGAGQAVFRQRAAGIWLRVAQWCKAPKVQQSEQGG